MRTPPAASGVTLMRAGGPTSTSVRNVRLYPPALRRTSAASTTGTTAPPDAPNRRFPVQYEAGNSIPGSAASTNPSAGNAPSAPSGARGSGPVTSGPDSGFNDVPGGVETTAAPPASTRRSWNGAVSISSVVPPPAGIARARVALAPDVDHGSSPAAVALGSGAPSTELLLRLTRGTAIAALGLRAGRNPVPCSAPAPTAAPTRPPRRTWRRERALPGTSDDAPTTSASLTVPSPA